MKTKKIIKFKGKRNRVKEKMKNYLLDILATFEDEKLSGKIDFDFSKEKEIVLKIKVDEL